MYFINLTVCEAVVYSEILLGTKIKGSSFLLFIKISKILLPDCEIHSSYGRNPGAVFLQETPPEHFEGNILNKIILDSVLLDHWCVPAELEGDKWD